MHSKSESGRTVLEMIVVIALIMLLIIGGLYGVERAYIKVQVKFVTERLITLKNQRMINAAQKQVSNRHTEQGPFGAELTLVNGEGNQDDYFWIIVKKLNAYFCNEMAKADVGAVEVDEQCPEESIFYFSKFSDGTGGGSSMTPDAGNHPSQNCEAGWSATRPSCRANQKLVSNGGCYQCQDLVACESPWESYVDCEWGREEKSLRLVDETICYQCVDSTDCPSGWSLAASVSCGVGKTKTIKSLANGTQCAQCETQATCSSPYSETVSCAANQKEEVAFTAADGKTCKKCTYLTSCADKSGYSATPCVRDKVVDQSFTLQGTSITCYKCKEITSCSDQTGYQEGNCQNNQTLVDSFTWNGKTCRKCVNMTTCASPWFSSATCYPGETKEEMSLANGTGKCYRCTGTAYTTCAAARLSSSTCGKGYTQTTRTLKNGTTCYECACQNSCGTQCCSSRESCQNGTTCVCSANYPVEDAEGNCQTCPTSTSRVIVAQSGDCKNVCSGAVETPNGDGTYSCCPRNYPRWSGTHCVACSGGTPYWDGTQCTVCPNETPHWNGSQCIACSGSTPLWTGTTCVACPTNGGSVVLTTSGVCASACNGAETDNGDGTYTCADASMMCQTAMTNAGFKQCGTTTTSECFTVSGNNVTWVHTGTSIMSLSSSKELIMPACNLTVNTRTQICGNMTVRDLTITNSSTEKYGLYADKGNKNTITVGGNLSATTQSGAAIYLPEGVTLNVAGDVTATSTKTSAVSTTSGSTFNVRGIFRPNGICGADLRGNADFAQSVEAESGGTVAALYLAPGSSDVITFHGNVEATSTKFETALKIISNANITFHGDVTATATSSSRSTGGAFSINPTGYDGETIHTITIGGKLQAIANGKFNGIRVVKATLNVTGDIVGISKGTGGSADESVGITVSNGTIKSNGGRIVGKTGYKYGIYMLCPAELNAARGIYYNGTDTNGIKNVTNTNCTITGTKYKSIPALYDSL